MNKLLIHPHALKHGLSENEIKYAWANFIRSQQRETPQEDQIVRIGYGSTCPTPIQMIGVIGTEGVLIIHAMTPPQEKVLKELGMPRRRK